MVIEKVDVIISFEQSKRLGKYSNFDTQKRNKAKNKFEKDFYKLINNGFFGKMLERIRNRIIIVSIKNCELDKIIEQQSKLPFNGIHKSYTNYSSYNFKQNEVVMDKPIYASFALLDLSRLQMYER